MSLLTYNDIALNLVKVHEWSRQFIYSGPNYVYTKHRLVVRAWFNPGTQTGLLASLPPATISDGRLAVAGAPLPFVPPAAGGLITYPGGVAGAGIVGPVVGQMVGLKGPGGTPNVPAVTSEAAVRLNLAEPRQQLVYSVGGQPVLVSPLAGFRQDCTNGPRPFYFNIVDIKGPRTFLVDYGIETDVNEAPVRVRPMRNVLSHTWGMEHVLDGDYFTKRVITGKVVFSADVLQSRNLNRDDFRELLLHQVPVNFKRVQVHVHATEDLYTYTYQIIDQELPLNVASNNVTRFEGLHTVEVTMADPSAAVLDFMSEAAQALSRFRFDLFSTIGEGISLATLATRRTLATQPVARHHVICKAWGNRSATRTQLEVFCTDVVNARLAAIVAAGVGMAGRHSRVTHDIAGKFVEVERSFTGGPLSAFATGRIATISGTAPFSTTDDTVNGTTDLIITAGRRSGAQPADLTGRDTYLEDAIGGALMPVGSQAPVNPTPQTVSTPPATM